MHPIMKKFILLLLITTVCAVSCKKEKKNSRASKPVEEGILGDWFTTSETHEFYNAKNEKVFTSTVAPNWKYTISQNLSIHNPEGQRLYKIPYTLNKSNNKTYLNFTSNNVAEVYEITSLEETTMGWRQEKLNVSYNDNGVKMAAKQVITMAFKCPCR